VSELLRRYNELLSRGLNHSAAITKLSFETGVDRDTVQRALNRARNEDAKA
jgi:hypothetical protein